MEEYYKTQSAVYLKKIFNETKTVSVSLLECGLFKKGFKQFDDDFEVIIRDSTEYIKQILENNDEADDMIFDAKEKMAIQKEKNKKTKEKIEKKTKQRNERIYKNILKKEKKEMINVIVEHLKKLNKTDLNAFVIKNEINATEENDKITPGTVE